MLKINVKLLNDDVIHVEIGEDQTLSDLKAKIQTFTNIEPGKQKIIYRGRLLTEDIKIKDIGLTNDSYIHVMEKCDVPPQPVPTQSQQGRPTRSEHHIQPTVTMFESGFGSTIFTSTVTNAGARFPSGTCLDTNQPPLGTKYEQIRQCILTIETLLTNLTTRPYSHLSFHPQHNLYTIHGSRYFLGQWVDCLDSANSWLEATIMNINFERNQVMIHFNGWPTRWDEWISSDSDRILPFRTKTLHSYLSTHSSPTVFCWAHQAPSTGQDYLYSFCYSINHIMKQVNHLVSVYNNLKQLEKDGILKDLVILKSYYDNLVLSLPNLLDRSGRLLVDFAKYIPNSWKIERLSRLETPVFIQLQGPNTLYTPSQTDILYPVLDNLYPRYVPVMKSKLSSFTLCCIYPYYYSNIYVDLANESKGSDILSALNNTYPTIRPSHRKTVFSPSPNHFPRVGTSSSVVIQRTFSRSFSTRITGNTSLRDLREVFENLQSQNGNLQAQNISSRPSSSRNSRSNNNNSNNSNSNSNGNNNNNTNTSNNNNTNSNNNNNNGNNDTNINPR